jgi:hypothetical protein
LNVQTLLMGVLHVDLDLQGHYSLLIFSLPPLFSLIPPDLSSSPSLYLFNFPPLFSLIPPDLSSSPPLYLFNFFLLSHMQLFFFSFFFFFFSQAFFLLSFYFLEVFFLLNVNVDPLLPALPTLAGDPNARPNPTGAPSTLICSAVHR